MRRILDSYSRLGTYYKFLPFLIIYIVICLAFMPHKSVGDEGRYLFFADNLLNGFYSPAPPDINLWNGPGYPMFIAFFLFLKVPVSALPLLNAFLMYFSLVILYKTIVQYVPEKKALLACILLGLYFPIYIRIPFIFTESLTWFLVTATIYYVVKVYRTEKVSWKSIVMASLTIAFLAMTKIKFGYVITAMVFISLVLLLLPHFRKPAKRLLMIFSVAFIFCLPWLAYTYSLTNKVFFWGNSGSMTIYVMSTPYKGETGQWFGFDRLAQNPNHAAFIDSIYQLTPLERDAALKKKGIENIKAHPKKYATNVFHNIGRLLFFPSDYVSDNIFSYGPFIPNIFIVVFITIAIGLCILYYKRIPPELIFLLLFFITYLFGSILVSAYRRMFMITLPFWTLLISYTFTHILSIRIKNEEHSSEKEAGKAL